MFSVGGMLVFFFVGVLIFFGGRASMSAEISAESQRLNKRDYYVNGTHYIVFYTPVGGMSTVNFTLDSIKRKWYANVNLYRMPNY